MEKYGFVYIWRDRKHKRYYIGSHWGTEDDGYICSSNWMKPAYIRRPDDFKRRILSKHCERKDMIIEENRLLKMISSDELAKKYYNIHNHDFGHWSNDEFKRAMVSEKIANKAGRNEKISQSLKGRKPSEKSIAAGIAHNTGRQHTPEHKQKISKGITEYAKNRSIEHRKKLSEANSRRIKENGQGNFTMAGRKHNDVSREKMRLSRLAFVEKQKLNRINSQNIRS